MEAKPSVRKAYALHHLCLVAAFGLVLVVVPLSQALRELRSPSGDGVVALSVFRSAPSEKNLRAFEKRLDKSSHLQQQIRPLARELRFRLLGELGPKVLPGRGGWLFYKTGVDYLTQPYFRQLADTAGSNGVLLSRGLEQQGDPVETLADLRDQLAQRGIELLVVPIPGKASIYPERLSTSAAPEDAVHGHTARFAAELQKRGLSVLLLHQRLRQARDENQPALYLANDTHWSCRGVRIAAHAIGDWIKRRPWFAATIQGSQATRQATSPATRQATSQATRQVASQAAQPRVSQHLVRREVTVTRRGDLAKMTHLRQQSRRFPAEQLRCGRIFSAGGPYSEAEDPQQARVLLLGDSFSRIYETDAPESAGLPANLAFELQEGLTTIVNDGGASTLVRQELARDLTLLKGKRLVVYAFAERDVRFGLLGWKKIALFPKTSSGASHAAAAPQGAKP